MCLLSMSTYFLLSFIDRSPVQHQVAVDIDISIIIHIVHSHCIRYEPGHSWCEPLKEALPSNLPGTLDAGLFREYSDGADRYCLVPARYPRGTRQGNDS